MARTQAGAQLTQLHRRRQLALRAATLRDLVSLWPIFRLDDIDGTWPALESALFTLIMSRYRDSAGLAANYYRAFRDVEGIPGRAQPVLAEAPDPVLVRATLTILGPIQAKKNIAAKRPKVAETTFARLSGSVGRQVMQGGRDTLQRTLRADPQARGWRRITDSSPCQFCAGIARQGVVGDDVDFKAHDHCGCTQEPAYA